MKDWNGQRVVILGAARQGLALARWLSRHGAHVTVSDAGTQEQLVAARSALVDMPVEWVLGGHPDELLEGCDLLCLSGGVPTTLPIVVSAVRRGIPLSNDTQVFMEAVPCRTVGITGSAGKTTTTSLVGAMARLSMDESGGKAYIGGNIGDPLINYVDQMTASDLAILEISSFQLEQMTLSPNVAAVLNITPNHLDRHKTMEAYTAAKQRLLNFQSSSDTAVLSFDDPGAWGLRPQVKGRLYAFSLYELPAELDGCFLHEDGLLSLRDGNAYLPLMLREKIQLRGEHNVSNVLAAFTIGHAAGLKLDAMLQAAEDFTGVEHRLELVREVNGVRWYNDSIATAPERSMAAIRSFDEPIVLLLGGRDKDLPWDELARLVHQRVEHVVLFGEAATKIESALAAAGAGDHPTVKRCETLQQAMAEAARVAQPGHVVLLSPGGTSYDAFKDFAERGERFREWVLAL